MDSITKNKSNKNAFMSGSKPGYNRVLRMITMIPTGAAMIALGSFPVIYEEQRAVIYGNTDLDIIFRTVTDNLVWGILLLIPGILMLFSGLSKPATNKSLFLTSSSRVSVALILSFLLSVISICATAYVFTEGGILAKSEEKDYFNDYKSNIVYKIDSEFRKYGYYIWESETSPAQHKYRLLFTDHILTNEQAQNEKKNMMCEMIFRARNNFLTVKEWAYADTQKDAELKFIKNHSAIEKMVESLTGKEIADGIITAHLRDNRNTIDDYMTKYNAYRAVLDDGITLYIENRILSNRRPSFSEKKNSDDLPDYYIEIQIESNYKIE